jgi:amidase
LIFNQKSNQAMSALCSAIIGFRDDPRLNAALDRCLAAQHKIVIARYCAPRSDGFCWTKVLPWIDIEELTIAQAQSAFATGAYSAEELIEAYLARITEYDAAYNAFTTLDPTARDQARAIDRKRSADEAMPPLAGVPIALKESIDAIGLPSTLGWARLSARAGGVDVIATSDAPLVARLRQAGAVIIGKTNIPPFSGDGTRADLSWKGRTHNAFGRALAPGASSTGVATAVSANFALAGIAEETGSSIQSPAAAQGIVGIKPTFGLVPNTGVAPVGGSTRDVVGTHARSVTDAALILDAIAGEAADDPKTAVGRGRIPAGGYASLLSRDALKGKRIGLYGPGWRPEALTDEVETLYRRELTIIKDLGATLIENPFAGSPLASQSIAARSHYDGDLDLGKESLAYDLELYLRRFGEASPVHSLETLARIAGASPFDYGEPLARWRAHAIVGPSIRYPSRLPDVSTFFAERQRLLSVIHATMREHALDAFIYPQMRKHTPPVASEERIEATTLSETSIAGVPGVVVPAGYFTSGAPFSLIVFGAPWREVELIGMAFAYEQATRHRRAPKLERAGVAAGP